MEVLILSSTPQNCFSTAKHKSLENAQVVSSYNQSSGCCTTLEENSVNSLLNPCVGLFLLLWLYLHLMEQNTLD